LRDLGTADPEWPTVDLRNAINAGFVQGPRLIVAAHILSASAGHGDLRGFYNARWTVHIKIRIFWNSWHAPVCHHREWIVAVG
jgi:hypothetical protein